MELDPCLELGDLPADHMRMVQPARHLPLDLFYRHLHDR